MAYPGEGYMMSSYKKKWYTPEQRKLQWEETVKREIHSTNSHPVNKSNPATDVLDSPGVKDAESYFNNHKSYPTSYLYDKAFHIDTDYNAKLKRDDCLHNVGLDVNKEEQPKAVPILSSSMYGHRSPLEQPSNEHYRVAYVRRDFYRSSGTKIPYTT